MKRSALILIVVGMALTGVAGLAWEFLNFGLGAYGSGLHSLPYHHQDIQPSLAQLALFVFLFLDIGAVAIVFLLMGFIGLLISFLKEKPSVVMTTT